MEAGTPLDTSKIIERRRTALRMFAVSCLPTLVGVLAGLLFYEGEEPPLFDFVVIASLVLASGAWGYALLARCPRCDNHFFFRAFLANPFAKRCVHCRLRKSKISGRQDRPRQ